MSRMLMLNSGSFIAASEISSVEVLEDPMGPDFVRVVSKVGVPIAIDPVNETAYQLRDKIAAECNGQEQPPFLTKCGTAWVAIDEVSTLHTKEGEFGQSYVLLSTKRGVKIVIEPQSGNNAHATCKRIAELLGLAV